MNTLNEVFEAARKLAKSHGLGDNGVHVDTATRLTNGVIRTEFIVTAFTEKLGACIQGRSVNPEVAIKSLDLRLQEHFLNKKAEAEYLISTGAAIAA